jgi:hypothetical protein
LLPPPGQVEFTDLQEEKCQEKENGRKQVLASMVPSPGADRNWIKVALQEKSKQSAVTTMMQQVHSQYQTIVATKTAEATATKAKEKMKAKPKKAKENQTRRPAETVLQDASNTPEVTEETAIRLCGCQRGDLSEVKSFTKAMATYYSRPNKFMEGRSCLDCQLVVTTMESNVCGQHAVVYYCDEGIKGFDAPDDDPMKSALSLDNEHPKLLPRQKISFVLVSQTVDSHCWFGTGGPIRSLGSSRLHHHAPWFSDTDRASLLWAVIVGQWLGGCSNDGSGGFNHVKNCRHQEA